MRKNKIISMICALAMVMSMFSTFTVANAAGSPEITSTATVTNGVATINVGYTGATAVANLEFVVPLSDEIFDLSSFTEASNISVAEKPAGGASYFADKKEVQYAFAAGVAASSRGPASADSVITITVPVKSGVELPVNIELKEVVLGDIQNDELVTYEPGTSNDLTVNPVTLVDPSATPTPTPRPTAPPRPTAKPAVTADPSSTSTPAPTKKPSVSEGLYISNDTTVENGVATIKIGYHGATAVANLEFVVPLSDEVFDLSSFTEANNISVAEKPAGGASYFADKKEVQYAFAAGVAASSRGPADADEVMTITVPVKSNAELPFLIELKEVVLGDIQNDELVTYEPGTSNDIAVNPIYVEVPAGPEATPTPIPNNTEIAIEDYVAPDAFDKAADAEKTKDTYMTIVLKDKDDKVVVDSTATDATSVDNNYGKTFVATWDGDDLTADEFQAIINGYDENRPISKAKGSLKLNIFDNSGITNVSTTVNSYDPATGETEMIADPIDNEPIAEPEDPTRPSYKVSPTRKTVDGGDTVNITATLTKADYPNGYIKVTVDNLDPVSGSGITVKTADDKAVLSGGTDVVYLEAGNDSTVKVDVSFKASAAKSEDSLKLTFDYVDAKNDNGASLLGANAKNNTSLITVRKQSTTSNNSSSGSSSSGTTSSGGNTLAQGNLSGEGVAPVGTFTDINDAPWAATAIATLASQGIVSGRGDGTFDPNANITRAEYCQILINTINASANYADTYFNDVPTDAWFYHAVAVASSLGIVSGYGDGNFGPYDLITREQMALMTLKAAQVQNVNLTATTSASFSDDAAIADWSKDAVYTLANAGIINGMDDGTFAPRANATRAQAAVIIYNTFVK